MYNLKEVVYTIKFFYSFYALQDIWNTVMTIYMTEKIETMKSWVHWV